MILTVTPNVALDRTLLVSEFRSGAVNRAIQVLTRAGGKGNNVARVARALGEEVLALGAVGGYLGRMLVEAMEQEGLPHDFVSTDAETRVASLIVDAEADRVTVINEPGPRMAPETWSDLAERTLARAAHADVVALSGSLPPGVTTDQWVQLVEALCATGTRVLVDTSGATLHATLELRPDLVKANGDEFSAALGLRVDSMEGAVAAARAVLERGPQNVVVTLGAAGAVAVTQGGTYVAAPPRIHALCDVGSGDALLAGVAVSIARGQGFAEGLRLGVAVAAANTLTLGAGFYKPDDLQMLLPQVQLTRL